LATDYVSKDNAGEQQRRTEWHNIVAWSRLAEVCGEYLTKGKLIYVEGRIQNRQWEDQSGNKRTAYEIVASEMKMLGSKADSERGTSVPGGAGASPGASGESEPGIGTGSEAPPSSAPEITDEDIPF
jgi:single-strand DNA-binding protein